VPDGSVWIGADRLQVLRHDEVSMEPGKALPGNLAHSFRMMRVTTRSALCMQERSDVLRLHCSRQRNLHADHQKVAGAEVVIKGSPYRFSTCRANRSQRGILE